MRTRERERDGRDIYKLFSNEIYRYVFIRGKEKLEVIIIIMNSMVLWVYDWL